MKYWQMIDFVNFEKWIRNRSHMMIEKCNCKNHSTVTYIQFIICIFYFVENHVIHLLLISYNIICFQYLNFSIKCIFRSIFSSKVSFISVMYLWNTFDIKVLGHRICILKGKLVNGKCVYLFWHDGKNKNWMRHHWGWRKCKSFTLQDQRDWDAILDDKIYTTSSCFEHLMIVIPIVLILTYL